MIDRYLTILHSFTDTAVTPFDLQSHFDMRSLSILEAAGIPLFASLNDYSTHLSPKISTWPFVAKTWPWRNIMYLLEDWSNTRNTIAPTWENLLNIIKDLHFDNLAEKIIANFKMGMYIIIVILYYYSYVLSL